MKCKKCEVDTIKGYLKIEKNFICFFEESTESEKIRDLNLPLIYGYKCPKCNKIEILTK